MAEADGKDHEVTDDTLGHFGMQILFLSYHVVIDHMAPAVRRKQQEDLLLPWWLHDAIR